MPIRVVVARNETAGHDFRTSKLLEALERILAGVQPLVPSLKLQLEGREHQYVGRFQRLGVWSDDAMKVTDAFTPLCTICSEDPIPNRKLDCWVAGELAAKEAAIEIITREVVAYALAIGAKDIQVNINTNR